MYKIENIKVTTGERNEKLLLDQNVNITVKNINKYKKTRTQYYLNMFDLMIEELPMKDRNGNESKDESGKVIKTKRIDIELRFKDMTKKG